MFKYGILNLKQALAQKWIRGGNDGRNVWGINAHYDTLNRRLQIDDALQEGKQAVERWQV